MKYPLIIERQNEGSLLTFCAHQTMHEDREPFHYLNDICIIHGSSAEGRIASFKKLTGAVQKACILISERSQQIYMPLLSERNPDNIWILYDAVISVKKSQNGCVVLFSDGTRREFFIDPRVIRLQMKRCKDFLDQINDPESF